MKNIVLLIVLIQASSCSLLLKRRDHFNYINKETERKEVDKTSGVPLKKNVLKSGEVYIYRYCNAPYWKEAVFGLLTFGAYTFGCNNQLREIEILFEDGKMVEMREDTNSRDRARY